MVSCVGHVQAALPGWYTSSSTLVQTCLCPSKNNWLSPSNRAFYTVSLTRVHLPDPPSLGLPTRCRFVPPQSYEHFSRHYKYPISSCIMGSSVEVTATVNHAQLSSYQLPPFFFCRRCCTDGVDFRFALIRYGLGGERRV